MDDIHSSTESFEDWLIQKLDATGGPDPGALDLKHTKMKASLFDFFRATFYRWAQLWVTGGEAGLPIAAVGDVHIENFGAWGKPGDNEGWGVNDFDEAALLPWTSDLARLGVSAVIGLGDFPGIGVTAVAAVDAILEGYSTGLNAGLAGGKPVALPKVLEELRKKVEPNKFWKKQEEKLEEPDGMLPSAKSALAKILGDEAENVTLWQRKAKERKGTGSLGKRRYFALATVKGERVMAEAKAYAPSALEWLRPGKAGPGLEKMVERLGDSGEPHYGRDGDWVTRRLALEMVKSELDDVAKLVKNGVVTSKHVEELFHAMGAALAKIHCLDSQANAVAEELANRKADANWYRVLVETWRAKMAQDFAAYSGKDVG